jgi:hypothetical protein
MSTKTIIGLIVGFFLLSSFKGKAAAPAPGLTPVSTPLEAPGDKQIFLDESGDLVFINDSGGTSVLPDPHGIGGGFAT